MLKEQVIDSDDNKNCVFVGGKSTMTYVFSVTTQAQDNDLIRIKARGRIISKAVDVALIVVDRFLKDWFRDKIIIGTEENSVSSGVHADRFSFIEIVIKKKI